MLGLVATTACAQNVAVSPVKAPAAIEDLGKGLPSWLLRIPTGQVWVGMTTDKLIEACVESVGQEMKRHDPAGPNLQRALRLTVSELGRTRENVPAFFLGKSPVTNRQYKLYLDKNKEARVPYHWWRYGRQDDYQKPERLEAIKREFPEEKDLAAVLYWERHWQELPFEVKNEDGKPIDDLPVVFVSWRDAMLCAAWLGMRLPAEIEWTRAARGDGEQTWLWGARPEWKEGDHYSENVLQELQLKNYRDRVPKEVGKVTFANGPFGHTDMVASVWQWTSNLGYRPLTGQDAFAKEYKKFFQTRHGANVQAPLWDDGMVAAKGGSYVGFDQDPITFHIDARTKLITTEVAMGLGFRLAKSQKPGLDTLLSMIRGGTYDQRNLGQEQSIHLEEQIGIEHYKLDATDFPESYQVLTFGPVNILTKEKGLDLTRLQEQSKQAPLLLGALVNTVKLAEPALEPGVYSVLYRHKGMPKELEEALKAGHKAVLAELRKNEKSDKPEEWRTVIAKYGIEAKELEDKDALKTIKFIRLGGLEIPTEEPCLLVMDCDGRSKAVGTYKVRMPVPTDFLTNANQAHSTVDVDRSKVKERVAMKCSVAADSQKTSRRFIAFTLPFVLDQAPGTAWRMPVPENPGSRSAQQGR